VLKPQLNQKKILSYLLGATVLSNFQFVHAAEEQFNNALRNANNPNALEQYRIDMQNDALGYYPEYWILNSNLGFQSPSNIINFAQRYPQSAMAEKLAADYVEEKVKQADFTNAQPVLPYVTNPDQAERCAIAQVRAKSGDPLVFAEYKDVWLTTNSQPDFCTGLGRMMLSSPLMTTQDRQQRLYAQLRAGQSGQAIATAQTIGLTLSLTQFNQIQANPLNYLWSAPKNNAQDYAYLIYALGRAADTDLISTLQSLPKLVQDVPVDVQKYIYRTVAYIGGTTVMKNNFNREVLQSFDSSYGVPFSTEEAEIYARQAIRFGSWESLIRAIDSMSVTQKQEDRWQYWLARATEQRNDSQSKKIALEIYQRLAVSGDNYHNLLAKDHIGQKYNTSPAQEQPSSNDQQRLSQDIHFRRAFALKSINAPAPT